MTAVQAGREGFRHRVDDAVMLLFAMVPESLGWATSALLGQDTARADRIIADDRRVDERCEELISLIMERLSQGVDDRDELEDLIAVLQMVPELERSADLAEHIAQRALRGLGGIITPRSRGLIQAMNDVAVRMWQGAGNAYIERSRDVSFALSDADDELDTLAEELEGEGSAAGIEPSVAAQLALVARFYERSGDHAVNLARRIDAMAAPRRMATTPPARIRASTGARRPGRSDREQPRGLRRLLSLPMRFRLVPKDEGFFDLFVAAATNARDCAEELRKLTVSFSELDEHYEGVKALERRGDQITKDLLRRLDASFVTPYDREDIHALAEELDDVVDDMFAAAEMIHLVRVRQPLPELAELGDILVAMADEMVMLVRCLHRREGARHRLERIENLERVGDVVYRRIMARLFSGEYEALEVLKWKDVVAALEDSLNTIEDVADVVETILVKDS